MKISKPLLNLHLQAKEMLEQDALSITEREFVLNNYHEGAEHMNGMTGAFFTPEGLARDFTLEISGRHIVDLCAGIGRLSYAYLKHGYTHDSSGEMFVPQLTCIEVNPEYYEVGRKVLPEANWILGSILDEELIISLPLFDMAISNPPFGKVKGADAKWLNYKGSEFEYKAIEVASRIAEGGVFIIPQQSASFAYSGQNGYRPHEFAKLTKFKKETGIDLGHNMGIDTSSYQNEWKQVSPTVEIVTCEFECQHTCSLDAVEPVTPALEVKKVEQTEPQPVAGQYELF
jgi:hypothetical protein